MNRPYTVEAEYMHNHPDQMGKHRTRSFATLGAAQEYAHWARNYAIFRWSLVRYERRVVFLWAYGKEQYYDFKDLPKE